MHSATLFIEASINTRYRLLVEYLDKILAGETDKVFRV